VEAIQSGLTVRASRPGSLRCARNDERNDAPPRSRAALFVRAPSIAKSHRTEKASKQIRGGKAPKGAKGRFRRTADGHCRLSLLHRGARPFWGRARLPALYRGSRQVFRLGSVRSRASWSRTTDPRPGQPAPGRPASWPAGRVSEPPLDEATNLLRGTAPARINRPSPVDVPYDERDD
jgi:hypothetical protein